MKFGLAAFLFVLWFGGYMALQYFVIGMQGSLVSAIVVAVYFLSIIGIDMKLSGWGLFGPKQ